MSLLCVPVHFTRKNTRENGHAISFSIAYNYLCCLKLLFDWGVYVVESLIFDLQGLNEVYREIAALVGIENAYIIFRHFGGQQITFPVKWLSKEYVSAMATEKYDGHNMKHLAKEYGYSERWLRQIIKKNSIEEEQQ